MSEQPTPTMLPDKDIQGWKKVAEDMHEWHPSLHEHVKRNLAKHGIDHFLVSKNQLASYEGGWGFFTENTITPDEFQITQDDDLLIETLLGEREKPTSKQEPLSPERQGIAQDGMSRLFAAAWGFDNEKISSVQEARQKLYELNQPDRRQTKDRLYQSGKYLKYQRPKPGTKYHEVFEDGWSGDYLHFGVNSLPSNTPENDKLDGLMRVYVHAKPEYAGHIAAEVIRRMRSQYSKEIYGKVLDISTANNPYTLQREDNVLFYIRTHSEMTALATILKDLVAERLQAFDTEAGKLDRARKTDIPCVSIAEEPIQKNDFIQESFNSSREEIEALAQDLIIQKFLKRYPQIQPLSFKEVLQFAYVNKIKTKQELKDMYRQAVKYVAVQYGVSQYNYAMNKREKH